MTTILFLLLLAASGDDAVSESIRRLGDDAAGVREAAVEKLKARGRTIVPELQAALSVETDPEVRARIALILRQLTQVRWHTDLPTAMNAAAAGKKPLLVFSTKGPLDGFV